jgi:hypothetical protein
LKQEQIAYRKNGNAFLAVAGPAALQAAADRLSPEAGSPRKGSHCKGLILLSREGDNWRVQL